VPGEVILSAETVENLLVVRAPLWTPLVKLTALPQTP